MYPSISRYPSKSIRLKLAKFIGPLFSFEEIAVVEWDLALTNTVRIGTLHSLSTQLPIDIFRLRKSVRG